MVAKESGTEKTNPAKSASGNCPDCGGALDASGKCPNCQLKAGPKGNPGKSPGNPKGNPGNPGHAESQDAQRDGAIQSLIKAVNLGMATAQILYDAGFRSVEDLKKASLEDLEALEGIDSKTAKAIQKNASGVKGKGKKSDDALKKWLTGESADNGLTVWLGGDLTARKTGAPGAAASPEDPTMNALKKWLTGEEDALTEWLGGEEAPPGAVSEEIAAAPPAELLQRESEIADKEEDLRKAEEEFESTRLEVQKLKETILRELESIQTGEFDPMKLIEESAQISRDLQTEIKKRKELEEDIEHIKKGTSAVVKYLKAQLMKGGGGASKKKLAEEELKRQKLEAALEATNGQLETLRQELEKKIEEAPADIKEIKKREIALIEKEAEVKAKEDEVDALESAIKSGDITVGGGESSEEELQSRMQEELRSKEAEFLKTEDELKKKIILLEEEIQKHKIAEKQREESARLRSMDAPEIEEELLKRERELQSKEKSILIREDEIQRLKEELRFKEDELSKLKEPLGYKEEELLRREEDMLYREKLLMQEKRKIEEAKKAGFGVEEQEMKDRLESLKQEIQRKEDEVRAKEKYLKAKMEELRLREQGLIEEEIEAREEERALELTQEKIKTGTPRLDDLLLGGIPFGSNIQIYGPPFVGKEVIVNAFISEGLKKGIPAIWVLTEKTPSEIRDEMRFVVSGYEEYEKLGLVKYIDAYSLSMEAEQDDEYTVYIEDPTDFKGIMKEVNDSAKEFKKSHDYYRLAFRSVSTLVAYLDVQTAFKFLQSFAGRRKRDKAVSLYMVEKGMHQDQEIQMMGSMMDGMIDLKVEQLKSYLSVQGVCDVQSRAWIKYTYSKHGVSIGSFSLDHIR